MKKVFISQPTIGKTDAEILAERERAIAVISDIYANEEIEILQPFFEDFGPDAKPLEYLGRNISCLALADVAYFIKDWENTRGCKIEHECAVQYDIEIMAE